DERRRDVLAASRDDQIFLAIRDLEKPFGVDVSDIAGVQPSILVDRLSGRSGILVVPFEDVASAHAYLAVRGDLELGAREAESCFARVILVRQGRGRGSGALAHAVDLTDRQTEAQEKLQRIASDRSRGGGEYLH